MRVSDIIKAIEGVAPLRLQEEYDDSGLQVGLTDSEVHRVLVSLDITEKVIEEAIALDCQMVVSHHPLIFRPLRQVSDCSWQQRCVMLAIRHGIALYSAHTNLDNARGGVNFEIADRLSLKDAEFLQARPGEDAGSGIIGTLESPMPVQDFLSEVKQIFGADSLSYSQTCRETISRVAVCGGSGAFLIPEAKAAGADCFLTGEIHYHDFFENDGLLLCSIGHYESEQYTQELLMRIISEAFPELDVLKASKNPAVLYK